MHCPIHEVDYIFVCPYCQAAKIAELENEDGTITNVRTRGLPWTHKAILEIKRLEEFEEAKRISRRRAGTKKKKLKGG